MCYKGTDQFVEACRLGCKNSHPVYPKSGDVSSKNCHFDMNAIQRSYFGKREEKRTGTFMYICAHTLVES